MTARLEPFAHFSMDGIQPDASMPALDDQLSATPYSWIEPTEIPLRPWVLGRWLLRGTVTASVAPGGVGKTTFFATTALSLVTGRMLLAKTVWEGRKRVWIWNLEDQLGELQRSIQAAAKHHGVTRNDVDGWLFVDTAMDGKDLCVAIEEDGKFKLLAPVFDAIAAELRRRKIDVLIIDPFVSSHEVDENANTKIDKIAKAWSRVAHAANCSIVLVHHTSKAGAGEVTALSARGAIALVNACRSALVFNRMDSDTADRHGFDDAERRRYFSVMDDKHNRAPAENADWFRLESVDLGNGSDLIPGDNVGVAEPWQAPDPFAGLTGQHLYRVQRVVDEGGYRADQQADAWVGKAVAKELGFDIESKADRSRINKMVKTWTKEGALKIVEGKDAKGTPRKFVEVGIWQNDPSPPPPSGEVRKGGAVGSHALLTTTPPPYGGVGCGMADASCMGEEEDPGAKVYLEGGR